MNNNLDFLNKTEVNSFVYSSVERDGNNCKNVVIDGRQYTKWGKEQIVTFVGLMYEAQNKDTNKTTHFVTVGMSKQHPQDIKHDKKIALETARINALTDPCMVFYNVSSSLDNYTFKRMMEMYVETMDLEFVMTRDELKKSEKRAFENDWVFYLKKKNDECQVSQ